MHSLQFILKVWRQCRQRIISRCIVLVSWRTLTYAHVPNGSLRRPRCSMSARMHTTHGHYSTKNVTDRPIGSFITT